MIIDSRKLNLEHPLETDLLIIGAGPAGITVAKQFANTSIRVTLLESGGESYDYAAQDLNRGITTGLPVEPLDASRLRLFGGTSNHWAGWCRPFEAEDFESREDWPESGWPISREDLNKYYNTATKLCQLPTNKFDDLNYWSSQPGGSKLNKLNLNTFTIKSASRRFFYTFKLTLVEIYVLTVHIGLNTDLIKASHEKNNLIIYFSQCVHRV